MYLISTHRSHVYQYAYYPAGKKNTQLLTSLHHKTNDTMSDGEEWYAGYVENHDDDDDDVLPDTEEVDEMKEKERGILRAESKVDDQVRQLGGTDLKRKFYDLGTMELKVCIVVEDEDDVNVDEDSLDKERTIEHYNNCLTVLLRDMEQIKEEFKDDIKVMEKMKNFRSNLNDVVATGAGVAENKHECTQDTAAMDRIISLRSSIKDYELGLRKRLFSEMHQAHNSLCNDETSDEME